MSAQVAKVQKLVCLVLMLAAGMGMTASAQSSAALEVAINADSARATLEAIQNSALSHEEAMRIASLPGNLGALRKLQEFHIPSTSEDFANALYETAHREPVTKRTEKAVLLDLVQPKVAQLKQLLDDMQAHPESFQAAIQERIAKYSPPGAKMRLQGYVVAGGDGGGYAFGGTDFYLNLTMSDDLMLARSVTTHEMYHAVQGVFAADREVTFDGPDNPRRGACGQVEQLFANLYEEGTAVLVADPSLLPKSHSVVAARILADTEDGQKHLRTSATLLEMTVVSLQADKPLAYDDVYSVGFLGHGVLYNIGYAMARSIADAEGAEGITKFLKEPPYRFVLRYSELPSYGKDSDHLALGEHTLAAAKLIAGGCH